MYFYVITIQWRSIQWRSLDGAVFTHTDSGRIDPRDHAACNEEVLYQEAFRRAVRSSGVGTRKVTVQFYRLSTYHLI